MTLCNGLVRLDGSQRPNARVVGSALKVAACLALGAPLSIHPEGVDAQAPAGPGGAWAVDPRPEVSIGVQDGPAEYDLTSTVDGVVLGDGTIVVALYTRRYFALRYFDQAGRIQVSVGRYGQGPFEVGTGVRVVGRLPGDSVIVVDQDLRYSIFGPRGESVRSGRLSVPMALQPVALLDAEHLIGIQVLSPHGIAAAQAWVLWRVRLSDGATDRVGSMVAGYATHPDDNGLYLRAPFEGLGHLATRGGRLW